MLTLAVLALASANVVSARRLLPRQSNSSTSLEDSLPSYMSYINATKNDNSPVTLQIDTKDTAARNATAPYLYGIMHEVNNVVDCDIDYSLR